MLLLIFIIALSFATANPVGDDVAKRADSRFCSTVKRQSCKSTATAYCSSYLSIPVKTVTRTTSIAGSTATITRQGDLEVISTTITISSCTSPNPVAAAAKVKRAMKKPACLSRYSYSNQISSACRCLSPAASTTTVVSTVTGAAQTTTTTIPYVSTNTYYELAPEATQIFKLVARASGGINGQYAVLDEPNIAFNADLASGTLWTVDGDRLEVVGSDREAGLIYLDDGPGDARRVSFSPGAGLLSCEIIYDQLGGCYLRCLQGSSTGYDITCAESYWHKGSLGIEGCSPFRPYAITSPVEEV